MDVNDVKFDDCIKLNKSTMTLKFSDHVNNETIVIIPTSIYPFIRYNFDQYHDNSTPWFYVCGPLILLMKELAKYRQSW